MSNFIIRKQNGTVHLSKTAENALTIEDNSLARAYARMLPYIGSTIVYCHNSGSRMPRTIGVPVADALIAKLPSADARTQHEQAVAHLRAILRHGGRREFVPPKDEQPKDEPREQPKDEPKDERNPHAFLSWVERTQDYQIEQGIDPWGMRQAINGAKLIAAGMPEDAVKDAFTIDFDDEARTVLGVRPFDLIAWGEKIAGEDESAMEAVIGVTIKAGVNACAVGGKGIGKTTIFEKIAEKSGAKIAVISCSDDGIRPDLFGTLTPGIREGYVLAEVADAMIRAENGEKVFVLLDEADALTPSDAIKLNRALEQRSITHPFLGRTIKFGRNVQFFAAMNTTGNGADEDYTGRDKQDAAFLDRFFRFRVTLDRKLQRELFAKALNGAL
jgi:hypothetical protein